MPVCFTSPSALNMDKIIPYEKLDFLPTTNRRKVEEFMQILNTELIEVHETCGLTSGLTDIIVSFMRSSYVSFTGSVTLYGSYSPPCFDNSKYFRGGVVRTTPNPSFLLPEDGNLNVQSSQLPCCPFFVSGRHFTFKT
jgi:hypothetical protein